MQQGWPFSTHRHSPSHCEISPSDTLSRYGSRCLSTFPYPASHKPKRSCSLGLLFLHWSVCAFSSVFNPGIHPHPAHRLVLLRRCMDVDSTMYVHDTILSLYMPPTRVSDQQCRHKHSREASSLSHTYSLLP